MIDAWKSSSTAKDSMIAEQKIYNDRTGTGIRSTNNVKIYNPASKVT